MSRSGLFLPFTMACKSTDMGGLGPSLICSHTNNFFFGSRLTPAIKKGETMRFFFLEIGQNESYDR
jgi:hypothetical protein